jgi:carotenoid 1,2-hydratase
VGRGDRTPAGTDEAARPLYRRSERSPGAGRADGGAVRQKGGGHDPVGLRFEEPVPPGGYAWWYVDALSDDGRDALTVIGFIGSVFSPYYRASPRTDPLDHSTVNVCLYGRGRRWTMTERGRADVVRSADCLDIGSSRFRWNGGQELEIDLEERATPIPRRTCGRIVVRPEALNHRAFDLDGHANHVWSPVAPAARVEVTMRSPAIRWSGHGYFDMNWGVEPLDDGFEEWHWSRSRLVSGSAVFYEGTRRTGEAFAVALRFGPDGRPEEIEPPSRCRLRRTNWLLPRHTRADAPEAASILRTLEDTPFYSRSMLRSRLFGEEAPTMHESLDLGRFRSGWVQRLLPYRMPRRPIEPASVKQDLFLYV